MAQSPNSTMWSAADHKQEYVSGVTNARADTAALYLNPAAADYITLAAMDHVGAGCRNRTGEFAWKRTEYPKRLEYVSAFFAKVDAGIIRQAWADTWTVYGLSKAHESFKHGMYFAMFGRPNGIYTQRASEAQRLGIFDGEVSHYEAVQEIYRTAAPFDKSVAILHYFADRVSVRKGQATRKARKASAA